MDRKVQIQKNHRFVFKTGKITSISSFENDKGLYLVKDDKNGYMLIDYIAASFLTCTEKMFIDEDTYNYRNRNTVSHKKLKQILQL